jgi:hypothetical protein
LGRGTCREPLRPSGPRSRGGWDNVAR